MPADGAPSPTTPAASVAARPPASASANTTATPSGGAASSQKTIRQDIVGHRGVDLNARHLAPRKRRFEHVEQTGRRHADEHDLVPEDGRVDFRLLPVTISFSALMQIEDAIARIRTVLEIVEKRRSAEVR